MSLVKTLADAAEPWAKFYKDYRPVQVGVMFTHLRQPASELISRRISELGDWRGKTLGRMRKLIKVADPGVVEEWKWMGTP